MPHAAFRATPLALALATILTAPVAFAAEEGPALPKKPTDLDKVEVVGKYDEKPASVKYTEPLRDTPQTITVINREVMDEQNLLGLRDALTTLPGITFGAGEGGGGYGDSITLRGFNASSDITTDNVRDSAQYSRTDSFNLQAIELVNGANSVYSGAGSVGGNINLVSKVAAMGEFTNVQLGGGTDGYGRATLDSNIELGDNAAFRINAMAHQNDAPGRDVETFERWGIAPSIAFGLGTDLRVTLSYFHQTDNNIPQYGLPYFSAYGGPLPGTRRENYYGYANVDSQDINVDMLTGVIEYDLNENTTIRSLARFQNVDQYSVVDAPQGTWCLFNGVNPSPTTSACLVGQAPGTFLPGNPSGPRGYVRDTQNSIAISQTDLVTHFETAGIEHALVAGFSISSESFDLDTGGLFPRRANGTNAPLPPMSISDPNNIYTGPRNYTRASITEGSLDNQSAYLFDTLKFDERWMLNLGARWEHNKGDSIVDTYSVVAGPAFGTSTGISTFENSDNLFSYRASVLFKPVEAGTLYLSYSNSKTPSKASVNGACTAQTCNVDPETAANIELGAKWDVTKTLAVTGALFRNDRQNYKVADPGNPLNPSGEQQLDGEARVDGVSLGVAGQITHDWAIFANATWLESEVLHGVSDYVAATVGDPFKGLPISGTPERSGSIWTTYDLDRWTFGYGVTYQSDYVFYGNTLATSYGNVHGYTTHRAMVSFALNDQLSFQLNANNLFDKEYYVRVRNNGWATPGDARSLVLTATYAF
ncbi:TonB-dependent outer membrane receptor [Lysobacter dokdonensis DS-58]|uniref:TonB-dependent outer membrane receptor n=1 Tax=Lysobacter dokdonensis DS-58 TaxID=1300345 RepID=A0A0A2WCE5_9GAMM|nr:TonB-dependent receptor [Lysobacter dokdonensis]KGQ17736.1 TonB-dependent outer membrane receptor [Lysobacter dokdonensis DS-58]